MGYRLLSNPYCLIHQVAWRKSTHELICFTLHSFVLIFIYNLLSYREDTQKMTRRLKRRYEEIHHTAPVSYACGYKLSRTPVSQH